MPTEIKYNLVKRSETSLANVRNQIAITSKILESILIVDVLPHNPIENLYIEGTSSSPRFDFKGSGELWIYGRMLELDPDRSFSQIQDWVMRYLLNPAKTTNLNIDLEYINTGSIKYLLNYIIKIFDNIKEKKFNIHIKWYCDKDDEDLIESINIISGLLRRDIILILK